jgi:hypothetical protein
MLNSHSDLLLSSSSLSQPLFAKPLNVAFTSDCRICITGQNGQGKSTLLKVWDSLRFLLFLIATFAQMVLDDLQPTTGVCCLFVLAETLKLLLQ